MGKRSNHNKGRKSPLALAATAIIGLAALWLGVNPDQLRNNPVQAVEQIGQAVSQGRQADVPTQSTSATEAGTGVDAAADAKDWPAFLSEQARQTVGLIQRGGPYPYRQDGTTFGNREKRLPNRQRGWYREYTVDTPGLSHRGPRRIVTGGHPPTEWYYTEDHYDSFRQFTPPAARSH